MTYGWAILIIAVVLGALFQLGVFSGVGAPKAPPGACQVQRLGSGIAQQVSLVGECQGQEPEYVAQFNGHGGAAVSSLSSKIVGGPITITGWVKPINDPPGHSFLFGFRNDVDSDFYILQLSGTDTLEVRFRNSAGGAFGSNPIITPNSWEFVALTYDGASTLTAYVNLNSQSTGATGTISNTIEPFSIAGGDYGDYFQGEYLANIQLYNISLSQNEIAALYAEGIGGAPVRPQNIVGWWPLNGNLNDYSGNNNPAQSSSISYSGSWTGGYTAP